MSHEPLNITDERLEELLEQMAALGQSTGGCIRLPEYDRTTKTLAVTVELYRATDADMELVPTYIAGFPVRVVVTDDGFSETRVVFLPEARREAGEGKIDPRAA